MGMSQETGAPNTSEPEVRSNAAEPQHASVVAGTLPLETAQQAQRPQPPLQAPVAEPGTRRPAKRPKLTALSGMGGSRRLPSLYGAGGRGGSSTLWNAPTAGDPAAAAAAAAAWQRWQSQQQGSGGTQGPRRSLGGTTTRLDAHGALEAQLGGCNGDSPLAGPSTMVAATGALLAAASGAGAGGVVKAGAAQEVRSSDTPGGSSDGGELRGQSGSGSSYNPSQWEESDDSSSEADTVSAGGWSSGGRSQVLETESDAEGEGQQRRGAWRPCKKGGATVAATAAAGAATAAARVASGSAQCTGQGNGSSEPPQKKSRKKKGGPGPGTCSHCGTTKTSSWRALPKAGEKLCATCSQYLWRTGKMRPKEVIVACQRQKGRQRQCFHCLATETRHWYHWGEERHDMCVICWQFARRHGGEMHPLQDAPPPRVYDPRPYQCLHCSSMATSKWVHQPRRPGEYLCYACHMYEQRHGGQPRSAHLWQRSREEQEAEHWRRRKRGKYRRGGEQLGEGACKEGAREGGSGAGQEVGANAGLEDAGGLL